MKKKQLIFVTASVLSILVPLFYTLNWILKAGELPTDDYWYIISRFYSVDGFSHNPRDWLVHSNRNFVLIPTIIYAINILVTKGSNLGLSLLALSFALIQSLFLTVLLPPSLKRSQVLFLLLLLCISVFSFTPAAAHNWMRGFSGVAWIGTNLFAIVSIFCLTKLANNQQLKWAVGSIVFGVVSFLTYSSSLALWPALCIAAVLLRLRLRFILLYISFASLILFAFTLSYKTATNNSSPSVNLSISKIFTYVPAYLGAIFTSQVNVALSIGIVGLVATVYFFSYWLLLQNNVVKTAWTPWLTIQIYIIVNAIMTAIIRFRGSNLRASTMVSRYASLPSLFWLSLIVIAVLWLLQLRLNSKKLWRLLIPFFAMVTILALSTYKVGIPVAQTVADKASLQPLVALSVQLGVNDTELVSKVVSPIPRQFFKLTDALKVQGLVPFNRVIKQNNLCTVLDSRVDSNLLIFEPQADLPGYFDRVSMLTSTVAKVQGWYGVSSNIKCIAILNQNNVVRGFAMTGFQRLDVVKAFGSDYEFSGWNGYVQILPEDRQLTAYALFNNRKEWISLNKSHQL